MSIRPSVVRAFSRRGPNGPAFTPSLCCSLTPIDRPYFYWPFVFFFLLSLSVSVSLCRASSFVWNSRALGEIDWQSHTIHSEQLSNNSQLLDTFHSRSTGPFDMAFSTLIYFLPFRHWLVVIVKASLTFDLFFWKSTSERTRRYENA